MAGEDEDVLLEIDRILAGEDEEPEATEAETETDGGEAEAGEDDGGEAPIADFDFGGNVEETDETEDEPVSTQNRINKTELISILFSRKTKLHFFLL
ncbi:MAG: hypothetical protein QF366_01955, partial [Candidatus Poseidoniia archaeon]|nr:hypothetical protein [Candidatus Poseidoniia archaeon]